VFGCAVRSLISRADGRKIPFQKSRNIRYELANRIVNVTRSQKHRKHVQHPSEVDTHRTNLGSRDRLTPALRSYLGPKNFRPNPPTRWCRLGTACGYTKC